jgi:hypothetical protein
MRESEGFLSDGREERRGWVERSCVKRVVARGASVEI